jgi:AraC family transcriptional regulator
MTSPHQVFEGRFGRVYLVDVTGSLSERSHPEPTILVKHSGPACELRAGDLRTSLGRGALLIVNAGEPFAMTTEDAASPVRLVLFHAAPDWLREAFPAIAGDSPGSALSTAIEEITPRIRRLADTLAIEAVNDRFLSGERLEFMLQELMLSIVDTYLARRDSSPLWRGSRFEDTRIRKAIGLLRARPNKEVNIDVLANRVGLSRSRFYHLFQVCTGRSPREYLDMLCIETAISRLASTNQKIADLSSALGFSAQSNFTRFFLNQVGIPPSQYRRAASAASTASTPSTPSTKRRLRERTPEDLTSDA